MAWIRRSRKRRCRFPQQEAPKHPIPQPAAAAKIRAAAAFEGLEPRALLAGDGLKGQYFDNIDLSGTSITRVDSAVQFDWGYERPDAAIEATEFSARWTGQVEPEFSETYTFSTNSDDGVRLWVDGKLLIDHWTDHAPTPREGSIDLVAGQKYDIVMEYYQNYGTATIELHWSSPSQAQQVIPTARLYSTPSETSPAPAAVTPVVGFTLVNADTDQPIRQLADNDTLDLATLPTRRVSIRADVDNGSGVIGSVRFNLNGSDVRTENTAPYSLSGDTSGNIHPWTPAAGSHTLVATPFEASQAGGASGSPVTLKFAVTDSGAPQPEPEPTPTAPTAAPGAPSNLTTSGMTDSRVTLTWTDNAGDESGFIVERSLDGQVFLPLGDVGANVKTYVDTGVSAETSYWYRVAAVNNVGMSAYSAPLPVTTPATTPTTNPTPPSNDIPAVTGRIIYVAPGQSIDAALDSANPGDHVVVKPGIYKESITVSRSGAEGKPIVLRPETPGTVTIDATGKATALINSGASYIFISGLTISGANNTESGNHNAAVRTGDNWVMQDCVIEKHAGGGMAVYGVNTVVRRVITQDNGRFGLGGSNGRNILIQDCITRRNNRVMGDSNGGGGKFTRTDGALIERLQSYENGGPGLWLDINNINFTIRDSEFHDNVNIYKSDGSRKVSGDGIDIEISGMVVNRDETAVTGEGPVVLENSRFWNNEHDGILAYASRNVTIRNNTLTDDHIYLKDGGRLPWLLTKLNVTGNTITRGFIQADSATVENYKNEQLHLDGNTFIGCTTLYKWSGTSYKTLDSIRSAMGYEINGVVK